MRFADYSFLYVEDDPLSRQVMKVIMETVLEVEQLVIFENSIDFMEHLRMLPYVPDVILLDIYLYPLDGFELIAMLRSDEVYRNCRIVAITASVMIEETDMMKNHGFDGVIAKPLRLKTFPLIIESVLNGTFAWGAE
jgi:CheY-like chemotaxis protein